MWFCRQDARLSKILCKLLAHWLALTARPKSEAVGDLVTPACTLNAASALRQAGMTIVQACEARQLPCNANQCVIRQPARLAYSKHSSSKLTN